MPPVNTFQRVSRAPTNPKAAPAARQCDVPDLYQGPLATGVNNAEGAGQSLDEKLRQACFWIVNHAIFSPHYDIESVHYPSNLDGALA